MRPLVWVKTRTSDEMILVHVLHEAKDREICAKVAEPDIIVLFHSCGSFLLYICLMAERIMNIRVSVCGDISKVLVGQDPFERFDRV